MVNSSGQIQIDIQEAKSVLGFANDYQPSIEEVKKAYKQKALAVHPDSNPESHDTEEFMLLSQAKELLIHEERIYLLPLGIGELSGGTILNGFKTRCGACHGMGILEKHECPECEGTGGKEVIHDDLKMKGYCDHCGGRGEIETKCHICDNGYKIFANKLKIPPGTRPDSAFILPTGEKIQIILKSERNNFTIRDNDIYGTTTVPWTTMIYGGTHITRDPNKTAIEIKINPGSQSGSLVRIHNKGFYGANGMRGDLLYRVFPYVPKPDEIVGTPMKLAFLAIKKSGF